MLNLTFKTFMLKIYSFWLHDLYLGTMEIQPPYFDRLESIKIELGCSNMISINEIIMVLRYLVHNC